MVFGRWETRAGPLFYNNQFVVIIVIESNQPLRKLQSQAFAPSFSYTPIRDKPRLLLNGSLPYVWVDPS